MPRALGVVQLRRRRVVAQLVVALLQAFEHQRLQLVIGEGVHPALYVIQHLIRRQRRAGRQGIHFVIVRIGGQTQLVHPQLGPPVVLQHHAPQANHVHRRGRRRDAVPHLGVHFAGNVAQCHIQVLAPIGAGSLGGCAHHQIAVKNLSLDHCRQLRLRLHRSFPLVNATEYASVQLLYRFCAHFSSAASCGFIGNIIHIFLAFPSKLFPGIDIIAPGTALPPFG